MQWQTPVHLGLPPAVPDVTLALWIQWLAVAAVALLVLLRAPWRDLPFVVVGAFAAHAGRRASGAWLGSEPARGRSAWSPICMRWRCVAPERSS